MIKATANLGSSISVTAQLKSVQTGSCADATYTNSDGSYSGSIASGGNLVVPNTPIKANGDLVINQPSTIEKDVVVRYETLGTVSTTIVSGEVVVPDAVPTPPITITNSCKFDGINDYLIGQPLIQNDEDFSITFWFKLNSLSGKQGLVSFYDLFNNTRDSLTIYYENNSLFYLSRTTGWNFNRTTAWTGDNDWHHFTFTNDDSTNTKQIYIDGTSLNIGANMDVLDGAFDKVAFANALGRNQYGAINMADASFHNSVLTQLEITAMQTLGVTSGHEVQRFAFTELAGTTDGYVTDVVENQKGVLRNMTTGFGIVAETP